MQMGRDLREQILDMSAGYNEAMKGNWNPLREFYKEAESKPVTLMLDTVLHIVAHSGQPELMQCLIDEVPSREVLNKRNDVGNTVLYEAACSGDVKMAEVVLQANMEMLNVGNHQGETPLFGAAANGHTKMVRYLDKRFKIIGKLPSTRRDDSTSILHIAILGQHHETALELIKLYPILVTFRDELGLTGLHLLASMPLTFRSGCSMSFPKKLIYSCLPTVKDEEAAPDAGNRGDLETGSEDSEPLGEGQTEPRLSSNYRSSLACSLRRALHRINLKIWDCLSHGWPAIQRVREEKNKHALVLQLVRELVGVDMSWMESHNGGDPHKITVFNPGKISDHSDDMNRVVRPASYPHAPVLTGTTNKLGGRGHHTLKSPPVGTHIGALPHPSISTNVFSNPLSEPPIVTNNDSLQLHSMPLMETEGNSFQQEAPPMATRDDGDSLDFRSQPPPLETYDQGGFQPPSSSSMVSNDHHDLHNSFQFGSELRPMATHDHGDGLDFRSQPPPMETNDDGSQFPSNFSMGSNDHHFQFSSSPPAVRDGSPQEPMTPPMNKATSMSTHTKETPLLIAAGKGIVEIVEEILAVFPQAVEYVNDKGHNILHVAVQHRQTKIFKLICTRDTIPLIRLNRRLDEDGNSVLHQAARREEKDPEVDHLRNIPGEALQMQWEIQWFKQVKEVVPPHFRNHRNKDGEKADEVFTKCHKELAKNGEKWLMRTANSCSLVATLIATVAFTSAYTVPGGPNQETGHPVLLNQPAFLFFTISDTISLSFALTSVVVFLSIMTSRFHEQDFHLTLPFMLVIGLTSLFLAVSAMMVSFAATLVLMIKQKLRHAAIPIYLVACLPVSIFLVLQFPLYVRVAWYTIGDILSKFRRSFSSRAPSPRSGIKEE